jgi:hypothetical protein
MWRVHHNSSALGVRILISPYEKCETLCSDFAMNFLSCEAWRQGHYQNWACTQLSLCEPLFLIPLPSGFTLHWMWCFQVLKAVYMARGAHLFHICHHSWALKYPVCCYIISGIPTISIDMIFNVSFCKFDYVKIERQFNLTTTSKCAELVLNYVFFPWIHSLVGKNTLET